MLASNFQNPVYYYIKSVYLDLWSICSLRLQCYGPKSSMNPAPLLLFTYVHNYRSDCAGLITMFSKFNLELSNFGITFLMWISKNGFLKFLKNPFSELLPFFIYFFKYFSVTLKSNYAKTNGDRNEILFAHKLTG